MHVHAMGHCVAATVQPRGKGRDEARGLLLLLLLLLLPLCCHCAPSSAPAAAAAAAAAGGLAVLLPCPLHALNLVRARSQARHPLLQPLQHGVLKGPLAAQAAGCAQRRRARSRRLQGVPYDLPHHAPRGPRAAVHYKNGRPAHGNGHQAAREVGRLLAQAARHALNVPQPPWE